MNRDTILRVADEIENAPLGRFSMAHRHECIASFCDSSWGFYPSTYIARTFGIQQGDAVRMYGEGNPVAIGADQYHAARMLRHYANTTIVDWEGTR